MCTVRLYDHDHEQIDSWTGWLVPDYLHAVPNLNAAVPYRLEIADDLTTKVLLPPGDLHDVIWHILNLYDQGAIL